MWPYALATLRHAWRSPLTWVLLGLGVFFGWFAHALAILALEPVGAQAEPLTVSTAHLVGVLLTLWLVGRGLDEDRASGFAAAADMTPPGPRGRLAGRWLGATSDQRDPLEAGARRFAMTLGRATALALLIPVTYTLDPLDAMYLAGGVMGATSFGGSISCERSW